LDTLLARLRRSGAELALDEAVQRLERAGDDGFRITTSQREVVAGRVIVTVGGKSYPGSGTAGDGYAWAAEMGHSVVAPRPALVPLTTEAAWVRGLSGITILDVEVQIFCEGQAKPLDRRRGSLLFAHFGLSGPVILDISRSFTALASGTVATLRCDFFPESPTERIEAELREVAAADGKRSVINWLAEQLPRRLVEAVFANAGISVETRTAEFSKQARAALMRAVKCAEIPISGSRGFGKAEVTAGGVALSEVDSRTMESKLVPGLYFAGEILDLDGPIGGYNFQAAFSTGVLAGRSV
jgi:hypothetical protein